MQWKCITFNRLPEFGSLRIVCMHARNEIQSVQWIGTSVIQSASGQHFLGCVIRVAGTQLYREILTTCRGTLCDL